MITIKYDFYILLKRGVINHNNNNIINNACKQLSGIQVCIYNMRIADNGLFLNDLI